MEETLSEQNKRLQHKIRFQDHVIRQLRHKLEVAHKSIEASRVDCISPLSGQILVMRYDTDAGREALQRMGVRMAEELGCKVLLLPHDCKLESIDPETMRALGWVHESELVTDYATGEQESEPPIDCTFYDGSQIFQCTQCQKEQFLVGAGANVLDCLTSAGWVCSFTQRICPDCCKAEKQDKTPTLQIGDKVYPIAEGYLIGHGMPVCIKDGKAYPADTSPTETWRDRPPLI